MKKVQNEALELFIRKNADYGDAFAKYGVIGVLMRIEDKLQRSLSITKSGVNLVADEGIRDTLIDLYRRRFKMNTPTGSIHFKSLLPVGNRSFFKCVMGPAK